MKISRHWLNKFFARDLPSAEELADALTFHAFEIEGIENDVLDVKVTANRGHDCLSHRGIAKEISAILDIPLAHDPLADKPNLSPSTDTLSVSITTSLCARYIAGHVKGVKVGPSPEWLRKNLEAIGQRSINNIVDATNFVMFNMGQPLHAFDADKLSDSSKIGVRTAHDGERMVGLDDKEYTLGPSNLAIVDGSDTVIGIAGVKGGKATGVDERTSDIIIESANFDGVSVRKTAAALKLRTDASARFEQVISPELAVYGARAAADLIVKIAGGEIVGFVDEYQKMRHAKEVSVSVAKINAVLGTVLSEKEVSDMFGRLGFSFTQNGDVFTVMPPFERLDLVIPEDLIEEVGRIVGYDKVPSVALPTFHRQPEVNPNFYAAELVREELMSQGFSEVFTSVFTDTGERVVANKVDGVRPYLRDNLTVGLSDALKKNIPNKDLLGLKEVKLFEIGTVWSSGKEHLKVATVKEKKGNVGETSENVIVPVESEMHEDLPISDTARYQPFSKYPFIVRDIAMWVPAGTSEEEVLEVIRAHAGDLLVHSELFDRFEKQGRISYAFRLVFQSFDRTLTDEDANSRMESVNAAVKEKGWEVR